MTTTVIDLSVERSVMLNLGRVGENNITEFVFDYTNWTDEFGEGVLSLVLKRQGDAEGYPKSMTVESGQSTWVVDSTDAGVEGIGEAQLTYTVNGDVKKSVIYLTRTCPSIEPVGPAPDPYQSWLDQMIEAKEDAENAAERAETAAENLDTKGYYPDMRVGTADNLLSSSYQTDKTPYIIRRTPFGARERGSIVGGSVVWNQLCNSASVTIPNVRKYFMKKGTDYSIGASTGTALTGLTAGSDMVIDLTLMFGSTIADYIYAQEQATAGAGVALTKAWAGITADYYPYDAGSIKSVAGLTAHKMTDGNSKVIGEYPLDSSLTLRGLPKLDGDSLYYDGDIYKADGTVTRKYGIIDLGSLEWSSASDGGNIYFESNVSTKGIAPAPTATTLANIVCQKYKTGPSKGLRASGDKTIARNAVTGYMARLYVYDSAYTDATTFKNAMDGIYLVYELATPTTEQAEPYTALQICDPAGTEEFVGASMPVGHETKYYADLKGKIEDIPDAPSADGTYTLKVTVSNGVAIYSWE